MDTKKKLSDWTLSECKKYCLEFRKAHGYPCETIGNCLLRFNNICQDWVHEWTFDILTDREKAIMRACGAKYVTMDKIDSSFPVALWTMKPIISGGGLYVASKSNGCIVTTGKELFPSLSGGDCIELED